MKKNKIHATDTGIRIKITETVADLAYNRLNEVQSALDGTSRVRRNRWHGLTSVYDCNRMANLLSDLAEGGVVMESRINTLASEIGTFDQVLGPNLARSLSKMINEQC